MIEKSWKNTLKHYAVPSVLKDKLLRPHFFNLKLREPVLDIGCGTGYFSELIVKQNIEIFAVDIYDEFPKISNVKYHNMDASSLKFSDNKFGDILMINILSCVDSFQKRIKILSEVSRVKQNNARIYLVIMSEDLHKHPFDDILLKTESIDSKKFRLTFLKNDNQKISFDDYLLTKADLEKYFKKLNLKVIQEKSFIYKKKEIYKLYVLE